MSATNNIRAQDADQATALPYRIQGDNIEFCLVRSSAGRWIFPKGIINKHETFCETALIEAEEEAGLHGQIVGGPLGCYEIDKDGKKMTSVAVLMKVTEADDQWKESDWRERRWVSSAKALKLLSEVGLRNLLKLAVQSIRQS